MSQREIRIGLLGHGTVGSAFKALVEAKADDIAHTTGFMPTISGVLTRHTDTTFEDLLARSDIIFELIGGLEPAYEFVQAAIAAGKPVITANKLLIAMFGQELFRLAQINNTQIYCEAAVAGAVPIIRTLKEYLEVIRISRILGIVNGTTNFILEKMLVEGMSYDDALQEAQKRGYAEADPGSDVSGQDAAAKMVILARLAFGANLSLAQIPYEGITDIHPDDVSWCQRYGYIPKLIGNAERAGQGLSVSVQPMFVAATHPLAAIHGVKNAVAIYTANFSDPITLEGPGAGGPETATAVLSDLMSAIRRHPGSMPEAVNRLPIVSDIASAFYLHLDVTDELGVMEHIMHILSSHRLSIKQMHQADPSPECARIGIVTHPALESRFFAALEELEKSDIVLAPPRFMRVLDV